MSSSQIDIQAPMPRRTLHVISSEQLFSGVDASLRTEIPSTMPIREFYGKDYSVPAAPPPSPVSFAHDCMPTAIRH
ncbi:hypothetical protein BROUX41_006487 [Berkeleyomyces rouxiae]|uniref:uncharacterized protein n=1 Tax=Berkeleyomyces rouxiae TaxID=2035830 RepID=UPI003B781891